MSRAVSQFSAANIGLQKPSRESNSVKEQFREEAQRVTKYLEGVHHSQKQSHAQVNYSETVSKLSKFDQEPTPYVRRPPPTQTFSSTHSMVVAKRDDTIEAMNRNAHVEHDLNQRKRAYNREVGRVAIVNSVLAGTAPMPKDILFPQRASHQSVLALTGTLACPDANKQPPAVQRQKKWLGEGVGWSAN